MNEKIIGIDLGTTNSEVAIVENGKLVVIGDESGNKILPSAVGVTSAGELIIGMEAKNQHIAFPEDTILSIKRKMGSASTVKLANSDYTPQEVSAMILRRLKVMAEKHLNQEVSKAVITVPAYFSDAQRQATKEAGEIAGLEVVLSLIHI
jgi:molecular chaperone DnaK